MAFAANELFRSIANGNWNSTSTWEMSTNGGSLWFAATSTPTNLSSTITINNTVTVTENVTADQIILSGGSDLSIASGITLTYPGNGGSILVSGNSISGAGTFRIEGSFSGSETKRSFQCGFESSVRYNHSNQWCKPLYRKTLRSRNG
ncbi:MAG: hypothetical protein R2942_06625 [Ignavibacteria bacterium]